MNVTSQMITASGNECSAATIATINPPIVSPTSGTRSNSATTIASGTARFDAQQLEHPPGEQAGRDREREVHRHVAAHDPVDAVGDQAAPPLPLPADPAQLAIEQPRALEQEEERDHEDGDRRDEVT